MSVDCFGVKKEFKLSSYYLRKIYPSFSRLVPVDIRRSICFVNDAIGTLCKLGYKPVLDISRKFSSLLSPLLPFGYGVIPLSESSVSSFRGSVANLCIKEITTINDPSIGFKVVHFVPSQELELCHQLRLTYVKLENFMRAFDKSTIMKKLSLRSSYLSSISTCSDLCLTEYRAARQLRLHDSSVKI